MPSKGNCCCDGCLGSMCSCSSLYQYQVTFSGLANGTSSDCTLLNATHNLNWVGGAFCSWRKFVVGDYLITLSDRISIDRPLGHVYLLVLVNGGFALAAEYRTTCWNCETGGTLTLFFQSGTLCGGAGFPATITVSKT